MWVLGQRSPVIMPLVNRCSPIGQSHLLTIYGSSLLLIEFDWPLHACIIWWICLQLARDHLIIAKFLCRVLDAFVSLLMIIYPKFGQQMTLKTYRIVTSLHTASHASLPEGTSPMSKQISRLEDQSSPTYKRSICKLSSWRIIILSTSIFQPTFLPSRLAFFGLKTTFWTTTSHLPCICIGFPPYPLHIIARLIDGYIIDLYTWMDGYTKR